MKRLPINALRILSAVILLATIFVSCVKKDNFFNLTNTSTRQTIVKILGGGTPANVTNNFIDFVSTPQQIMAADIRRDPTTEADLNTTMNVVIKDDTAAVRAANSAYVNLPAAWYTIQAESQKVGGVGGTFTFIYKPGDFVKEIKITIPDATLLDPSTTYALGFTITSVDDNGVISDSKSVVITIAAKNFFDGKYHDVFTNYHPSLNPGYTGDATDVELWTTGPNTCKIYWPDAGAFAEPSILGGGFSYFGAQEPAYTINTATNAVTVQNAYVGAVTFYTMAANYNNHYDPSSRTIVVKWGYSYTVPGVWDSGCREWTQTLTYTGPR